MSDSNQKPAPAQSAAPNTGAENGASQAQEQHDVASATENAKQASTTGESGRRVRKSSSSEVRR